jgi:hypothetical protein
MYFRLATGYLPFAPEGFFDWPIVTAALQNVPVSDVADQWMAFAAFHGVNTVLMADRPQSLLLKRMLETLKVSPLKVGGVLLYRIPAETLAPYANLMEARENEQRFRMLLIAAHRYLAEGANPAGLTLATAVQRGLLAEKWSDPRIQRTSYMVWLSTENGRISFGLTGHYEALRPLIERYGRFAQQVYFPHRHRLGHPPGPGVHDCRLRRLLMVFDNDGLNRAASLAMVARNGSPSALVATAKWGPGASGRSRR